MIVRHFVRKSIHWSYYYIKANERMRLYDRVTSYIPKIWPRFFAVGLFEVVFEHVHPIYIIENPIRHLAGRMWNRYQHTTLKWQILNSTTLFHIMLWRIYWTLFLNNIHKMLRYHITVFLSIALYWKLDVHQSELRISIYHRLSMTFGTTSFFLRK